MSFGMFPIVIYTGYACFPPKTVSWVLSVDTMISSMVAPGCRDSSNLWFYVSVWKLNQISIAHLCRPPPITCIHLTVYLPHSLIIHIVFLRGKNQVLGKFGITVDRMNTRQDVLEMELKFFISKFHVLALEWWAAMQTINDRIKFNCGTI